MLTLQGKTMVANSNQELDVQRRTVAALMAAATPVAFVQARPARAAGGVPPAPATIPAGVALSSQPKKKSAPHPAGKKPAENICGGDVGQGAGQEAAENSGVGIGGRGC